MFCLGRGTSAASCVIYDALNLITMQEGGLLVGLCYILLYEMDPDSSLSDYVTRDRSRGRISCRMRMMSMRPGKKICA